MTRLRRTRVRGQQTSDDAACDSPDRESRAEAHERVTIKMLGPATVCEMEKMSANWALDIQ